MGFFGREEALGTRCKWLVGAFLAAAMLVVGSQTAFAAKESSIASSDPYSAGTGHISIVASDDGAIKPTEDNKGRFAAIQVFEADDQKGTLSNGKVEFTNIRWGSSVDGAALSKALAVSDIKLAANESYNKDGVNGAELGDVTTLGQLYCTYLKGSNIDGLKGVDIATIAGGTKDGDLEKVSGHYVADFLKTYATVTTGEDDDILFPVSSPFSQSAVATAFAHVVATTDGVVKENTLWQSSKAQGNAWVVLGASAHQDDLASYEGALPAGYYVVCDLLSPTMKTALSSAGLAEVSSTLTANSASETVLVANGQKGVAVDLKGGDPSLVKGLYETANNYPGSVVHYYLDATLPANVLSYSGNGTKNTAFKLDFEDTFGSDLNASKTAASVKVYVGKVSAVNGTMSGATQVKASDGGYTASVEGQKLTVSIPNVLALKDGGDGDITIKDGDDLSHVYVLYQATLKESDIAGTADAKLLNTALIRFSNDPNGGTGTASSAGKSVQLYTYGLKIHAGANSPSGAAVGKIGLSLLQASGSEGSITPVAVKDSHPAQPNDPSSTKIAKLKLLSPGKYQFLGWADSTVVADETYADAFKEYASSETTWSTHGHEGSICEAVDTAGHGTSTLSADVHNADGLDGTSGDNVAYLQVMQAGEDGTVEIVGLGGGAYTLVQPLSHAQYDVMAPVSFYYKMTPGAAPLKATLNASDTNHAAFADGADGSSSHGDGTATINVGIYQALALPMTGGQGVATVIGIGAVAIVLGIVIFLIRRKDAEAEA